MGSNMAKIQIDLSKTKESYPRGWTICVDLSAPSAPRILLTYMIIVSPSYQHKEKIKGFHTSLDNPLALSEILQVLHNIDSLLPIHEINLATLVN